MKANAKMEMVKGIEKLAVAVEGGVYSIPENKMEALKWAVEAFEKFAILEKDGKCYIVYKSKMRPSGAVAEFKVVEAEKTPEEFKTGEKVKTPRGTFSLVALNKEQMQEMGYNFHHQSDDGAYLIMGNGTNAFAIAKNGKPEKKAEPKAKKQKAEKAPKEKPEGLMGLTIAELRQMSKELGLPYMHKHRALSKEVLVANIEAKRAA